MERPGSTLRDFVWMKSMEGKYFWKNSWVVTVSRADENNAPSSSDFPFFVICG
jgi:hypothetical protein